MTICSGDQPFKNYLASCRRKVPGSPSLPGRKRKRLSRASAMKSAVFTRSCPRASTTSCYRPGGAPLRPHYRHGLVAANRARDRGHGLGLSFRFPHTWSSVSRGRSRGLRSSRGYRNHEKWGGVMSEESETQAELILAAEDCAPELFDDLDKFSTRNDCRASSTLEPTVPSCCAVAEGVARAP